MVLIEEGEEIIAAIERAQQDICIDMGHGEVNEVHFWLAEALRSLKVLQEENIHRGEIPPTDLTLEELSTDYGTYHECTYGCRSDNCGDCIYVERTPQQEREHRERMHFEEFQLGHPMSEDD